MSILAWCATAVAAASIPLAGLRWLRVAQREHYLPGRVSRFAYRWWASPPYNIAAFCAALGCVVAAFWVSAVAFPAAALVAVFPLGLGVRGRTSRLAWTRRLRVLALTCAVLAAGVVIVGIVVHRGAGFAALTAIGAPLVVDAGLAATRPIETLLARRFVVQATETMRRVRPRVVAITGSYGKTSTKGYVKHLTSGAFEVVASPASYNNRAGICRTVNEHVRPETEVLVAEMGTYGPGEIEEMCRFVRPEIAMITAIGPVHLERFGSLERTLEAKSEITEGASTIVLATDDALLAGYADKLESEGRHVIRCSGSSVLARGVSVLAAPAPAPAPATAVCAGQRLELHVDGVRVGESLVAADNVPASASNVACAVGAAVALGLQPEVLLKKLSTLPVAANRLQVRDSSGGFRIIDDTYNANPAGARVALGRLAEAGGSSNKRVVVTPGMIELGPIQSTENEAFAAGCATIATDVVVVGRTNKRALVAGLTRDGADAGVGANVVLVANRDEALEWIRANLATGDVVLYENDLPDHFP